MILVLRTDKPEAEIGLIEGENKLAYETWHAHRQLAETLHTNIHALLEKQHKTLADVSGIVVYEGPGSFTGIRIGISVANALAYGLGIPIVATTGDGWREQGIRLLNDHRGTKSVMPEYGAPVHITKPKK